MFPEFAHTGKALKNPYRALADCGPLQDSREVDVLTEPCGPVIYHGSDPIGDGFVVVDELQPSGAIGRSMIHISRLLK